MLRAKWNKIKVPPVKLAQPPPFFLFSFMIAGF